MENNTATEIKSDFILATCIQGGKFEIIEHEELGLDNELNEYIEAAECWKEKSPGGDALVINKSTMEILWPERLKGKKVEPW